MNETPVVQPSRSLRVLQVLRAFCHLIIVLVLTAWAALSWPLPLPGIFTGLAALVFTVVIWALFLSPRPVLRTDRFGQALIELLLLGGAVAALLALGVPWLAAAVFGLAVATIGYFASASR